MVGLAQSLKEFGGWLGQVSNARHSALLLKDHSLDQTVRLPCHLRLSPEHNDYRTLYQGLITWPQDIEALLTQTTPPRMN